MEIVFAHFQKNSINAIKLVLIAKMIAYYLQGMKPNAAYVEDANAQKNVNLIIFLEDD